MICPTLSARRDAPSRLPRILIVADRLFGTEVMRAAVSSYGYSVAEVAWDFGSAQEALACSEFDGVLLGIDRSSRQCVEFADALLGRGIPFALIERQLSACP